MAPPAKSAARHRTSTVAPDEGATAHGEAAGSDSGTPDAAEVLAFLVQLGVALLATGDAVSDIEDRLLQAAKAYDQPDTRVMVLPRAVLVAGVGGTARLATPSPGGPELRLDQVTEMLDIATAAGKGEISPAEGRRRLDGVRSMPNRHSPFVAALGYAFVTLGVGLVIRPVADMLPLYIALGLFVALLRYGASRVPSIRPVLPVIAAALVSAIVFKVFEAAPLRAVIPPLVVFLPGALLTMATVDLASDEVVTGATRFVAGILQLALLAVGITLGARLVGVTPRAHANGSVHLLGSWAPWVGVLIFGLGTGLEESAPRRSVPWLLLVLYAAWAGQLVGAALLGPLLSGFGGGVVVAPLAKYIERFPAAPPALVSFLPAFWLLVPGSLGLIGVTQLVGDRTLAGAATFVNALISVVAIALGILVGLRVQSLAKQARDSVRALKST